LNEYNDAFGDVGMVFGTVNPITTAFNGNNQLWAIQVYYSYWGSMDNADEFNIVAIQK
jgi:hypothetical protein